MLALVEAGAAEAVRSASPVDLQTRRPWSSSPVGDDVRSPPAEHPRDGILVVVGDPTGTHGLDEPIVVVDLLLLRRSTLPRDGAVECLELRRESLGRGHT